MGDLMSGQWWWFAAKKLWAWLKTVPAWVWTVAGFALAYMAWSSSRTWKKKAEVQHHIVESQVKLATRLRDIRIKHTEEVERIEEKYAEKKAELKTKAEQIEKAQEAYEIAGLVNKSFKKDDDE